MTKPEQDLLIVNPYNNLQKSDQLLFVGPFNIPIVSWIGLTNITDQMVCFKIKITVPKKYCVRPNSGSLAGKAHLDIQVLLQPFLFDPEEEYKHKIMIQSVIMPESNIILNEAFWNSVDPEKVMNYKVKCVFALTKPVAELAISEQTPISDSRNDIQKILSEIFLLREKESKLKEENQSLKEKIVRTRYAHNNHHSYMPPKTETPKSISFYYIAFSVAVAFVALLFGKYVL